MRAHLKDKHLLTSNRGVTLLEVLIATTVFVVLVSGIWSSFTVQKKLFNSQQQVAMIQQNLRATLCVMEKQLRMAGYNPSRKSNIGIQNISGNNLIFSYDNSGGGRTTVEYDNTGDTLEITLDGATPMTLAENVYFQGTTSGFALAYAYDADGDGRLDTVDGNPGSSIAWAVDSDGDNDLDLNLDTNGDGDIDASDDTNGDDNIEGVALASDVGMEDIRAVKVWLLVEAEKEDPNYSNSDTFVFGRTVLRTSDHVRRRLLTSMIKCRNLGT